MIKDNKEKAYKLKDKQLLMRGFIRYYMIIRTEHLDNIKRYAEHHRLSIKDVFDQIFTEWFDK